MLWLTLLSFATSFAFGQSISPQLIIGAPLIHDLKDCFQPSRFAGEFFRGRRSQYIIGAGLDTLLTLRLRLDTGILYRRISYDSSQNVRTTGVPTTIIAESSVAADRWEFPVTFATAFLAVPSAHSSLQALACPG